MMQHYIFSSTEFTVLFNRLIIGARMGNQWIFGTRLSSEEELEYSGHGNSGLIRIMNI